VPAAGARARTAPTRRSQFSNVPPQVDHVLCHADDAGRPGKVPDLSAWAQLATGRAPLLEPELIRHGQEQLTYQRLVWVQAGGGSLGTKVIGDIPPARRR
jgi:hypothetical protein